MTDVPFSFGIITDADHGVNALLKESVESIRRLNIPQYEIIIVGNQSVLDKEPDFQHSDIKLINFNESEKYKWITKKKNIITDVARYEQIVYQHDYIVYEPNWYDGFKVFGSNFNLCMNRIINPLASEETEGVEKRFRDLILDMWTVDRQLTNLNIDKTACVIPYNEYTKKLSKYMYISGAYWVAKKTFMMGCRLNESLAWGEGEDVEFSRRARMMTDISFNPHSTVKLNKPCARIFKIMTIEEIRRFKHSVGIK